MANYNPLQKPKASLNRSGFDLSQRHTYSQRIGELLPVLCIDCVPGDYHVIKTGALVKTMPVRTDAFARVSQHVEFFFVPYHQLWHDWDSFVLQRESMYSSEQRKAAYSPCFNLNDFLDEVSQKTLLGTNSVQNSNVGVDALRLADMLGYGAMYSRVNVDITGQTLDKYLPYESSKYVNVFRAAAYQKIWYDYYRNKQYDTDPDLVLSWNFDDIGLYYQSSTPPVISDSDVHNRTTNARQFCGAASVRPNSYGLFTMRYRQWKKDLFMSSLPNAQMGLVSAVDLKSVVIANDTPASGNNSASVSGSVNPNSGALYVTGNTSTDKWSVDRAFSVYDLKKAEYLQKWKETVMRAGDNVQSQYKARFGVHSRYNADSSVDFLGSFKADVEINPVYNTATDNSSLGAPLGEIGGRAQALGSGEVKFSAQDYGVLMAISSFVPETEYDATMIDKQNTLTEPFDFFTPEFEDSGLEPVYHYQLDAQGRRPNYATSGGSVLDSDFNKIEGYTSFYSMYKTAVDKCHDAFMSHGESWYNNYGGSVGPSAPMRGSLNSWTIPRSELQDYAGLQLRDFYISPYADESIFYRTKFAPHPTNDRSTSGLFNPIPYYLDSTHYLCDTYFDVKSVRPMSVLGLPQW